MGSASPTVRLATMPSKGSSKGSKKAKKSGSNVFDMFTQAQVAEFKDGFAIMDRDHDGVLSKEDLRGVYDEIGRLCTEEQLEGMLSEAPGPINFTTFLQMFANKSSGEADDDEVVAKAFRAFEKQPGEIDMDTFRNMLMAFGDKFTNGEVDDAYAAFDEFVDEDTLQLDCDGIIGMLCAGGD